MKCEYCKGEFKPKRVTARFCSPRCRVYRSRGLVKKPAAPKPENYCGPETAIGRAHRIAESKPLYPDPALLGGRVLPPNLQASAVSSILAKLPGSRKVDISVAQGRGK